jgi:hypothetical protein
MSLIAVDAAGNHVGLSSYEDRTYLYFDESMQDPQERARTRVSIAQRWERRYGLPKAHTNPTSGTAAST